MNASVGDKVAVTRNKETFEGILLQSSKECVILLKLDNGYNLGFDEKKVMINIVKKCEASAAKIEKESVADPTLNSAPLAGDTESGAMPGTYNADPNLNTVPSAQEESAYIPPAQGDVAGGIQ